MKVIFVLMVASLVGCRDGCNTEETRCNGDVVEICNSKEDWEVSVDCADISDGIVLDFECDEGEDGEHECILTGGYEFDAGYYDAGYYDAGFYRK